MSFYQCMSLSTASCRTYLHGQHKYEEFCKRYYLYLYLTTEHKLRLFATFMARSLANRTIKVYLAAVKFTELELGYPDNFGNMLALRLLLRGIKRVKGVNWRLPRLPITTAVLKGLKTSLRHSNFHIQDQYMLWAAFTLAFFGFLRSAEFRSPATSRFSTLHTFLRSDITIHSSHLFVHVKVSKADPFRNGSNLIIHAMGSSICRVRAMTKYLDTTTHNNKPLFIFCNGSYLTRSSLTSILRALLGRSGIDISRYSSHSFRIGAATTAAAANIPDWLIKVMGR